MDDTNVVMRSTGNQSAFATSHVVIEYVK